MKTKRLIFVGIIAVVASFCLAAMNIRFDRLSRYPYQDQKSRELIDKYLDDQEIEYLIEYSIAPSLFVRYIEASRFSVYHIEEYNYMEQAFSYRNYDPHLIVMMVEDTRDHISVEDLAALMNNYTYDEVKYWLDEGDPYYLNSTLVLDPTELDALVDDDHTIGIHESLNLVEVEDLPVVTEDEDGEDKKIMLDVRLIQPLKNLFAAAKEEIPGRTKGKLVISEGYVSYKDQEKIYSEAKEEYGSSTILYVDYPGHSEHQLGFAVDFSVTGKSDEEFSETVQAQWLQENAWRFGFIQSYTEDKVEVTNKLSRPQHYRYVGESLAQKLYEQNLTLKEGK